MNIVLTGSPGSGKGTLAKQLQSIYGYYLLIPGSLYRQQANLKTDFGLKAKEYWKDGNLCPDEMTNELVLNTIKEVNNPNIIFDGYPRRLTQAKYLDSIAKIDLVLDLNISDEISTKRLLGRRDKENRLDDTEEIIKQRLKVYHSNNDDIIAYYLSDLTRYRTINAELSIEAVLQQVISILNEIGHI